MRYTEARLAQSPKNCSVDLNMDTVDWVDNFDGSLQEPKVLPPKGLPNLLLNGASGLRNKSTPIACGHDRSPQAPQ